MKRHNNIMKMLILAGAISLICLISTDSHRMAHADTIRAAAMKACPYNCDPETDGKKGFMVEIGERIFARAGHTFTAEVMPFNRAVRGTVEGTYDAIALCNPNDAKELIIPKKANAVLDAVFMVRKGETWKYSGLDSLKSIRLASFPGATWEDKAVNHYLETTKHPAVQMIYGEDPIEIGIRMLLRKRVDACLTEMNTARYYGSQIGLDMDALTKSAGTLSSTLHYIGFSPKNPKSESYARILDQGMGKLRASGELKAILESYGMTDWEE